MKKITHLFLLFLPLFPYLVEAASIQITPQDTSGYNTWRPLNNATLDFLVTVSDYSASEGEIQFHFTEVSNWPGISMNDPIDASHRSSKQDLCLYSRNQTKKVYATAADARTGSVVSSVKTAHISWETQSDGRTDARFSWTSDANLPSTFTIVVTITAEDYGAFGTLQALLYKKRLLLSDISESATIQIPKDTNNNDIADAWETTSNGWGAGTTSGGDVEKDPGGNNTYKGDGFTAFEEYRGFKIKGTWNSLNLSKKDVFVHSDFDSDPDTLPLGRATDANGNPQNGFPSYFKVHFIRKAEMNGSGVVNTNECIQRNGVQYWIVSQKAIRIHRDTTTAYAAGNPFGEAAVGPDYASSHHGHTHGGVPHHASTTGSTIYTLQILEQARRDALTSINTRDALYKKCLRNTIAHEFAHNLGLADHNLSHILRDDPQNPGTPLVRNGQYVFEYTRSGLMFYEQHIDNERNTFRGVGESITPNRGLQISGNSWTSVVSCAERPHHGEAVCRNAQHWLARDPTTSAAWEALKTSPAIQVTLKKLPGDMPYACGEHSGPASEAAKHAEKTGACGHEYYTCTPGNHDQLQASCSTDSNCLSTNFYLCQHDTHAYDSPSGDQVLGCSHTPIHEKETMYGCGHEDYSCKWKVHYTTLICPPSPSGEKCTIHLDNKPGAVYRGLYRACQPHEHVYPSDATPEPPTDQPTQQPPEPPADPPTDQPPKNTQPTDQTPEPPADPQITSPCGHTHAKSESASHQAVSYTCNSHTYYPCLGAPLAAEQTKHTSQTLPCGQHTGFLCTAQAKHTTATTCPTQNGVACTYGTYYACTLHTHKYKKPGGVIRYEACGQHLLGTPGDHTEYTCPKGSGNRVCQTSGGTYFGCLAHTHTYNPVHEACGVHSYGTTGDHSWVSSCTVSGCTNTSGYYACTPHSHTYNPDYEVCGTHSYGTTGDHSWVSSCTVSGCTNTSGYYACTPHSHTYNPDYEACGVHSYGTTGDHAWVSSCTVSGCTNTSGYYACTPHSHTYNPVHEACGTHGYGTIGDHSWVSSCTVSGCTSTSGYYACTPHSHTYNPVHEACGVHSYGTIGDHSWVSSCAVSGCTNTSGYYACTPHDHKVAQPYEACGVHTAGTPGDHRQYTCPRNTRRDKCQTTSGRYWGCLSHTHSYPGYHACDVHKTDVPGDHSWVNCPPNDREDTCSIGGYYACQSHTHDYPEYHVCDVHTTDVPGDHSWVNCPLDRYKKACRSNGGGYYACLTHTHDYPKTVTYHACRVHSSDVSGDHSWVTCAVNKYQDACRSNGGGYYACLSDSHSHSYPGVRPCGVHSYGSGGNHSRVSCPQNISGDNCEVNNGRYHVCSPHMHRYPDRRRCGDLASSSGNHDWVSCPTNGAGDACSIGGYYACKSHTHSYPNARPCGHSYSQRGNHDWVSCPTNTSGDNCSIGGYYACKASSHTHSYPNARPCGHSYSQGGNHDWVSCPTNTSGDNCSIGGYYACKASSHTHNYPNRRPCGHLYSASGNHSVVYCPSNSSGDNCSIGSYYACKSHRHRYPARRPCGHLYSASGNHSVVYCPSNSSGDNCSIGSYYACKSHTHDYPDRRPCGHLYSTGGSHYWVSSCSRRSNGRSCNNTSGYYVCKPHRHTYSSSGNNSSGNNSSGNNSSGNDSSGNNSSGNNSSGNNSSGNNSSGNNSSVDKSSWVLCGRSRCGDLVPTRNYHATYCGAGHYIWGCHAYTVRVHSRH